MTLAKAKSVNRQTLENVVRNAASDVYAANCDCVSCLSKELVSAYLCLSEAETMNLIYVGEVFLMFVADN